MKKSIILSITCLLFIPMKTYSIPKSFSLLYSLKGTWSFSIGTNNEWSSVSFNDSNWETIKVPSPWENQGFNGYNGYAFYRKKVTISPEHKGRMLYLCMGYIDDVDEVYLNGVKIGSTGSFPPNYRTAYNAERIYLIPEKHIRFGVANVIAVKVYDTEQAGGIVGGEIGIYGGKPALKSDIDLQVNWKFKTGDDLRYKDPSYDDSRWDEIMVPAKWEDQGYRDYDGYGWYRKSFVFPGTSEDDKLVIVLGKIDDLDQVYVNGTLVGTTGNLNQRTYGRYRTSQEYNAFRGYYLPAGLVKKGQKVVIAVRVYDSGGEGGIYEGPVGIITQTKYIEYWRALKKSTK